MTLSVHVCFFPCLTTALGDIVQVNIVEERLAVGDPELFQAISDEDYTEIFYKYFPLSIKLMFA
jgi:hypothetical protein